MLAFLFTDIEGSTRLAKTLGDRYEQVLDRHREIMREEFSRYGGSEVGTEGDSFFVVFASPVLALQAASSAQAALGAAPWPEGIDVRVRMGLHVGEAHHRDGDYIGVEVHRAARVAGVAHGGQILLSEAAAAVIGDTIPEDLGLRDLGFHRLKDFDSPARLFQVTGSRLASDFPPIRTAGRRDTNLPTSLTSFVGREAELADLEDLLGSHRLISLIGTGGSGKTRLMLEVAARIFDRFDGAWLVELAPIRHADLVVNEVARVLGIRDEPGRSPLDAVIDFLRSKPLLILLDNCEHLIGAVADMVEILLVACPTLKIVCTSREALGVRGETLLQVPSLSLPTPPAVDHGVESTGWFAEVAAAEAVRLFVDRARAVLSSFSLNPDNALAVVEICRRLDGIPLAIELAAARIKVLSAQEIALRLNDRFRLLTGGSRTALPRQQTLQALIDWSWDLLAEPDKALLRRLAVFAGGWTLQAAEAITRPPDEARGEVDPATDILDGLGQLIDRSLVVVDRTGSTRYRLLETIRQYGLDKLSSSGEALVLRRRHLAYFLDLAVEAVPHLRGPGVVEWLERLDAEADNLRSALDWGLETGSEKAIRLAVALNFFWRSRSVGSEALDFLARASSLARRLPKPPAEGVRDHDILVSRILSAEAFHIAIWKGGKGALELAEEAYALARQVDDAETWSGALAAVSVSY
ncbi:MAG TPA: adenylate/guanylate cyclase domain-containing protein, partial [Acidimicrobiia bacterium]|nr:adenylate/guanylate cyclase domain-containing protein [Acidimicrobiia bacterium]